MKTDDFVNLLATGSGAVDPHAATYRLAAAVATGALGAALLMAVLLGVRHDLALAAAQPMFWVKAIYVVCLALASALALARVARPGARLGGPTLSLCAPVLLMWALAVVELTGAAPAERRDLLLGKTWATCPLLIATLSVPPFIALTWAMRAFAATRLRLAGAALGLAAGGIAAVAYSLHCPELAAPFLGSWYLAGLLIPTALGVLVGPRLLRW